MISRAFFQALNKYKDSQGRGARSPRESPVDNRPLAFCCSPRNYSFSKSRKTRIIIRGIRGLCFNGELDPIRGSRILLVLADGKAPILPLRLIVFVCLCVCGILGSHFVRKRSLFSIHFWFEQTFFPSPRNTHQCSSYSARYLGTSTVPVWISKSIIRTVMVLAYTGV